MHIMPSKLMFLTWSTVILTVSSNVFLNCTFTDDGDKCGFQNDETVSAEWTLSEEIPNSANSRPADHTNTSGHYLYADAAMFGKGDKARILSQELLDSANACVKIGFYYFFDGEGVDDLIVYITEKRAHKFETPVLEIRRSTQRFIDQWVGAEIVIKTSLNFSIAFETTFNQPGLLRNKGGVAIDDIIVILNDSCDKTSCNNGLCLNNGICQDISEDPGYSYSCDCAAGWEGYNCQNDINECASSPCMNGTFSDDINSFACKCDNGYYGERCEMVDMCNGERIDRCQNGGTCINVGNDFDCACVPGFTGIKCDIDIDECSGNPCRNGGECVDGINTFLCNCPSSEYYGLNCQYLSGECDFEEGTLDSCGYANENTHLLWKPNKGKTPFNSVGPSDDHTGGGYYVYAEVNNRPAGNRAKAILVTPVFPQESIKVCTTIAFWYYMEGENVGTLNVYVRGKDNLEDLLIWTADGDHGANWNEIVLSISYSISFLVVFESVSKQTAVPQLQESYIGLDDITIISNNCEYDYCFEAPCKNGGNCSGNEFSYTCQCNGTWTGQNCTEDKNECNETIPVCFHDGECTDANPGYDCNCMESYIGQRCEYLKGSCNFEDPETNLCQYHSEELTPGFTWERNTGPTKTSGTGPDADHSLGNEDGHYIYVEASGVRNTSIARIISPEVSISRSQCIGLGFWYHMKGTDIGKLTVYLQFGNERPTTPLWLLEKNQGGEWMNAQFNISASSNFKIIFEATVNGKGVFGPDNQGDIAIDDIFVSEETCDDETVSSTATSSTFTHRLSTVTSCLDCDDDESEEVDDRLGAGAIAGIIIGIAVAVILTVAGVKSKKTKRPSDLHNISLAVEGETQT